MPLTPRSLSPCPRVCFAETEDDDTEASSTARAKQTSLSIVVDRDADAPRLCIRERLGHTLTAGETERPGRR
jgi:hypothetical protein